jgi:hypothetical protein
MQDERDQSQTFSSGDRLKQMVIDKLSKAIDLGCKKEEPIADYTTDTGFVRCVAFLKSMLWKWTPDDIKTAIKELYMEQEKRYSEYDDKTKKLSEDTIKINKQKIADDTAMQVLEFLLVVVQFSPMSTEYKEMEVFGDMQELIKSARSKEPVKLFSGEIEE